MTWMTETTTRASMTSHRKINILGHKSPCHVREMVMALPILLNVLAPTERTRKRGRIVPLRSAQNSLFNLRLIGQTKGDTLKEIFKGS